MPQPGEKLRFLKTECGCLAEVTDRTNLKNNEEVIEVEVKEIKKAVVSFE